MAAIDPTARYANVIARLNNYFADLDIPGVNKAVLAGETGFVPQSNQPWVRYSITNVDQKNDGRFNSAQTARARCLGAIGDPSSVARTEA